VKQVMFAEGKKRIASTQDVFATQSLSPCISLNSDTERTESFKAQSDDNVEIHTLVLGTHPSIESLSRSQYFGHPMNAFWWIAGDCLGFRRDLGISPASHKPYKFTEHLRYGADLVLPYERQVRVFLSKGFALWDVVKSCEREGSLDSSIRNEEPNSVREFCEAHPSIRRIILANGTTGCKLFQKHFRDWWEEDGELVPEENEESKRAFSKYAKKKKGRIKVICALAVSPTAARFSYLEKRDFWEKYCYEPGLQDYYKWQSQKYSRAPRREDN